MIDSSVVDEVHDFQRFERRTRDWKIDGDGGWHTMAELKIVCRCGWSADWIAYLGDCAVAGGPRPEHLDEKTAVVMARALLGAHVAEAIDRAYKHKETDR